MMRLSLVQLLLCLVVSSTAAQPAIGHYPNEIGIYTTETPTGTFDDVLLTVATAGVYTLHLVCTNPVNEHTGEPITTLGGFELSLDILPGFTYNDVRYPGGCVWFAPVVPGDFNIACPTPVVDGYVTLASIDLVNFGDLAPGGFYLAPLATSPTIAGHMAVMDGGDDSFSRAYPISGGYDQSVMLVNMSPYYPIPAEDTSWSEIKTLYR